MLKHNGSWRKIHQLSHPIACSVNNHIPDSVREMRYTQFQDILQMIIPADKNYIIMKHDVKDVFMNVPVVPY